GENLGRGFRPESSDSRSAPFGCQRAPRAEVEIAGSGPLFSAIWGTGRRRGGDRRGGHGKEHARSSVPKPGMESVAIVGSGPSAAHWVRLCLASGFEVLFLRKTGPISRVFQGLSRLEGPDLVLVVGEDTSASWIAALESRMSPGAVLATTFA